MARYYFLTTILPDVVLDEQPRLSFEELIPLYLTNMTASDFEQFQLLRRWIDIQNLRLFWEGLEVDPRGNWLRMALDRLLLTDEALPAVLIDYLLQYESDAQRLEHYPELLSAYLRQEVEERSGFLQDYFAFERRLSIILTGLRAKRVGRDLAKELATEDPTEPTTAWMLSFRDAASIEPPPGFEELGVILERYADSPMLLRRDLTRYQLNWVVERVQDRPFTLEFLLGYAVQLLLVERYHELDAQAGEAIVEQMVNA